MEIKDFVFPNNLVQFDSYRAGVFYYKVRKIHSEDYYLFQVPLEDIGGATLLSKDKAITYMRWIRKGIENNTFIKQ